MVEPISTTIATAFVVGLIMGIIHEIHEKTLVVIWVLAVVFVILSFFIQGPTGYTESLNWGVLNWVSMFITVNIAFLCGKFGMKGVKGAFKK